MHEAICAERYKWILLWLKTLTLVIGVSASGLIAALWQIAVRLPPK